MEKHSELLSRLVTGHRRDGRCCYDPAAKEELIRACLKPGASIARLAMQHGVNANLLRTWVGQYQKQNAVCEEQAIAPNTQTQAPAFTPVQIETPSARLSPSNIIAAVGHSPATASNAQAGVQEKCFSIRLHVRLPNGVELNIGDANSEALSPLMQMLSQLPCSDSTTR